MKKYLLMLLACSFVFIGIAQDTKPYRMYDFVYLKPNYDKLEALQDAMASHNQKYHKESPYKASVWNIQSGTYAGWWAWIMGPCTYSELDNRPNDEEHEKDWNLHVMPNVLEISGANHWKQDAEVSFLPEIDYTGKEIWTIYDIKSFEGYRFTELLKKITTVFEAKSYKTAFEVYRAQFKSNQIGEILIASTFVNWAHFDEDDNFKEDYEEVFGEGSWWKFMEEYKDIVVSVEDQVALVMPELGGRVVADE